MHTTFQQTTPAVPVHAPPDLADTAAALIARGAHQAALRLLLPALQAGDSNPRLLDQAAGCYWALGDSATALALARVLVGAHPGHAGAWGKLGAMALSLGDHEAARDAFEKAVLLDSGSTNALAVLNRLAPFRRGGRHHRALRALARRTDLAPLDRRITCNALGRIEEAAGNHRAALRFFLQSKALAPGTYDPGQIDARVAAQVRLYRPDPVQDIAAGYPRLVFVVGMPRSGTTLVENILTRHPEVGTIGESKALSAARQMAERMHPGGAWAWSGRLDPSQAEACRARFRAVARWPDRPVVVDKMPLDCLDMGLAHTLFPDARFVFMLRHPLDVGLSALATNFHEGNAFSHSMAHIGHLIRSVHASLDDHAGKLGPALHVQSYRALVSDPEAQIPALLDHVGLAFDPACLTPEAGRGAVRTASVLQVREKINTGGLDKWKAYGALLDPLVDALGGVDWLDAWHARDHAADAGTMP